MMRQYARIAFFILLSAQFLSVKAWSSKDDIQEDRQPQNQIQLRNSFNFHYKPITPEELSIFNASAKAKVIEVCRGVNVSKDNSTMDPNSFFEAVQFNPLKELYIDSGNRARVDNDYQGWGTVSYGYPDTMVDIKSPFTKFFGNASHLINLWVQGDCFADSSILKLLLGSPLRKFKLQCHLGDHPDLECQFFEQLARNTTLTTLDISFNDLQTEEVFRVAGINTTLQKLVVQALPYAKRFTDINIDALCNVLRTNSTLQKLDLEGHVFSLTLLPVLQRALVRNSNLQELVLSNSGNSELGITLDNVKCKIIYKDPWCESFDSEDDPAQS